VNRSRSLFVLLCTGITLIIIPSVAAASELKRETMPEGCVRDQWSLKSPSMEKEIRIAVVRPPDRGGPGQAALPVLYALHGKGAPYLSFTEMVPLRKFLIDHPMLLVVFDAGDDSGYVDATHRQQSLYTTFFFEELIPEIRKRYAATDQMALTGFSMGGYGAFHYMLSAPDTFQSVSALSGAFSLFEENGISPAWEERYTDLIGKREENLDRYDEVMLRPRLEQVVTLGRVLPPMMIICGAEDFLLEINRQMVDTLSQLNDRGTAQGIAKAPGKTLAAYPFDFEYREYPGGHDWLFWKSHSEEIARFHWQFFHPADE
jgi:S-formylglutathione hydrolase FrmB